MKEIANDTDSIRSLYSTDEFEEFYEGLNEKVQSKFDQTLSVIKKVYVLNTKFVKKLVNSNLYEMRVSVGTNEYRTVLFAIDNENIILSTKIVLISGFLKKSTKDYNKEITRAERILNDLTL